MLHGNILQFRVSQDYFTQTSPGPIISVIPILDFSGDSVISRFSRSLPVIDSHHLIIFELTQLETIVGITDRYTFSDAFQILQLNLVFRDLRHETFPRWVPRLKIKSKSKGNVWNWLYFQCKFLHHCNFDVRFLERVICSTI